jgi:hypothetical protein
MSNQIPDEKCPTKTCKCCGETKFITEFHKHSTTRDKLYHICKTCCNARAAKWRRANPDRIREQKRSWKLNNAEQEAEYQAEYYMKNKERLQEYKRQHYQKLVERARQLRDSVD